VEGELLWAVGGAIEHGSFLMALAAVALTGIAILLALGGVIAYIRVHDTARKVAAREARETATGLAEQAANNYLQAEIPAIIAAYGELSQSVSDEAADRVAAEQGKED
jgi:hypothetical protein